MTLLANLAGTSRRVSANAARSGKIRELAAFLRTLAADEIDIAVHYLSGEIPQGKIGIGYSSLSYLNRFPLDRLKIDRAFVLDMLDARADLAIVRAIIELGHELGLRVVAEGVESEHQARILRTIGCDELQGFLFSKALSPADLWSWTNARKVA